ncbi:OOP family OmpA-OmpF porin [Chryseobacterium defluvii]|uniref:OOP family OmpA-OmpF porin n=1 Tax=Chryseobacterium defluvii TaxID=160396 RepID=A0A840KAC8_9FLAO|nr:OmpA family protein [Chryseobacterium defluvii]MBB4806329.1 OOP family OmpA-OmpF porin [Chryseobacterium defluvii]
MKLGLLLLATLPIATYAQDSIAVSSSNEYPNTFSSGSANVQPFNNASRRFKDWAISVGGGAAFMTHSDLTSFYDKKINWGYNAYVSLDKQISHTFGLSLIYQKGETNQKAQLPGVTGQMAGVGVAKTKYDQIALMGDINFSNLLRRVDNHSPYRWALHGYAGIGLQSFHTSIHDNHEYRWSTVPQRVPLFIDQKIDIGSFFYQGGIGLKYKVSRLVDIEARTMYVISGDDEFDGGGWAGPGDYDPNSTVSKYNMINDRRSDNLWTVNLGLTFKLGKHLSHLTWHDPLQEAYYRTSLLENATTDLVVCERGDNDNDGVCDDWDRQLDTPAGARVDGAGVALDMDLDGVIDLYDKCVTVPGPVENNGCPTTPEPAPVNTATTVEKINDDFQGIEFELNSDKIRPQSFEKLNHAADIIKTLDPNSKYAVIGATDTRGSETYNLNLSQKRANSVVKYLTGKGVSSSMLVAEGRGESDLKYPECDPATKCPEWKNEANRRVYFQAK